MAAGTPWGGDRSGGAGAVEEMPLPETLLRQERGDP